VAQSQSNGLKKRLVSWNVNGLRAVAKKGFLDWFQQTDAFIVSLQEIKARPDQVESELLEIPGYHALWNPAEKAGYSGTLTYTKGEPLEVYRGLGDEESDAEGRVLQIEFDDWVHINAYFPNSQRDHQRLPLKMRFCEKMWALCQEWREKGKGVVLCGDYNIAHQPIDLKNPKSNEKNAGFLPEERAQFDAFVRQGFVDIFRKRCPEPGHYTWWSYRPGIRARNVGWRLDYHCINSEMEDRISEVGHWPQVMGSDHCPIYLELSP